MTSIGKSTQVINVAVWPTSRFCFSTIEPYNGSNYIRRKKVILALYSLANLTIIRSSTYVLCNNNIIVGTRVHYNNNIHRGTHHTRGFYIAYIMVRLQIVPIHITVNDNIQILLKMASLC